MTKRMLIDGTHAEETRVVVADDTELLEFDFDRLSIVQCEEELAADNRLLGWLFRFVDRRVRGRRRSCQVGPRAVGPMPPVACGFARRRPGAEWLRQ